MWASTKPWSVLLAELARASVFTTPLLIKTRSSEVNALTLDNFDGGIGIVEMLFRCNILALVGGGEHPKYPTNKVMLWDDHQQKCIGELTFKEDVLGVRLRKDKVIVVLEKRIFVYNFSNLNLIDSIDTVSNPTGLCAVSYEDELALIACPDKEVGRVKVNIYLKDKEEPETPNVIEAHTSNLAALALNY